MLCKRFKLINWVLFGSKAPGGAVYKENLQPKKRSKKYYRKILELELAYVLKAAVCGSFKVAYKF
jgi:hypothetical protein